MFFLSNLMPIVAIIFTLMRKPCAIPILIIIPFTQSIKIKGLATIKSQFYDLTEILTQYNLSEPFKLPSLRFCLFR